MTREQFIAKYSGAHYGDAASMEQKLADLAGLIFNNYKPVEVVTAAKTLTADVSGNTLVLNAAAGAELTLPAVATSEGFHLKVIVGAAFATTAWTI